MHLVGGGSAPGADSASGGSIMGGCGRARVFRRRHPGMPLALPRYCAHGLVGTHAQYLT
jgi:hypothetical protein